jgi:hypothetical protein
LENSKENQAKNLQKNNHQEKLPYLSNVIQELLFSIEQDRAIEIR